MLRNRHTRGVVLSRRNNLLIGKAASTIIMSRNNRLLICPNKRTDGYRVGRNNIFVLTKGTDSALLTNNAVGGLNNRSSSAVIRGKSVCHLKASNLRLCDSNGARGLSIGINNQTRIRTNALRGTMVRNKAIVLLSPADTSRGFIMRRSHTPIRLAKDITLLSNTSVVVNCNTSLRRSAVAMRRNNILVLSNDAMGNSDIAFDINGVGLGNKGL